MAFEHKPGSFSLFKNTYKSDGDQKPDYKGKGKDLAGNDIEVAAWKRDGKDGVWLSCKISVPREKQEQQRTPAQDALDEAGEPEPEGKPAAHFSNMKDDIPFAPHARFIAGHVE